MASILHIGIHVSDTAISWWASVNCIGAARIVDNIRNDMSRIAKQLAIGEARRRGGQRSLEAALARG